MTIKKTAINIPTASPISIDKDFCFNSGGDSTISRTKAALEHFSTKFSKVVKLDTKAPIFLDANVLLSYYGMASSEKAKLIAFLRQNQQRLHLTNQVQKEYLANRVSVIKSDLFAPLSTLGSDLRKGRDSAVNAFRSSLEGSKRILEKDYPVIWEKLKATEAALAEAVDIESTVVELEASVKSTTSSYKEITIVDDMLDACSKLPVTTALSETEVTFLEKLFDELQGNYSTARATSKAALSFPGQGDVKGKEYPYGDFFIFHEIMKFMKLNHTDAVFLTNEKSKGDWMDSTRTPHLHYIETAYANTGHVLFILHAEEPLRLSMENIHDLQPYAPIERESPVFNKKPGENYGFLYGEGDDKTNVFFHRNSFVDPSEFDTLKNQDYVRFNLVIKDDGRRVAETLRVMRYDLSSSSDVRSGRVHVLTKRYGSLLDSSDNMFIFNFMNVEPKGADEEIAVGDAVEFLVGLNFDGDPIVRSLRKV
jgi:cold shock CspA family protein